MLCKTMLKAIVSITIFLHIVTTTTASTTTLQTTSSTNGDATETSSQTTTSDATTEFVISTNTTDNYTTEATTEVSPTEGTSEYSTSDPTTEYYTTESTTEYSTSESTTEYSTTEGTTEYSTSELSTEYSTSEGTTDYSTEFSTTEYSTSEPTTEFSTTEGTTDYSTSEPTTEYSTTEGSTEYPTSEPTTKYSTTEFLTSEPSTEYSTSEVTTEFSTTEGTTDYSTSEPTTEYSTTEGSTEYPTSEPTTEYSTTEFLTSEPSTEYSTSEVTTEYSTSESSTEYSTTEETTSYSTSEPSTEYSTSDPSTEFSTTEGTTEYSTSEPTTEYSTTEATTEYSTSEPTTEYSTTEATTEYSTSEPSTEYSTTEGTTQYSTSEPTTEYSTTEASTEYSTSEPTTEYSTTEVTTEYSTSEPTTEYSTTEGTTEYSTSESTTEFSTTEGTTEYSTSESTTEYSTTEGTTEYSTSEPTTEYSTTEASTEYSTSEPTTEFSTTEGTTEYSTSESSTEYSTSESTTEYSTSEPTTEYSTTEGTTEYSTSESSTEYSTSESTTEYSTSEPTTEYFTTEATTEYSTSEGTTDFSTSESSTAYSTTEAATDFSTSEPTTEYSTTDVTTDDQTSDTSTDYSVTSTTDEATTTIMTTTTTITTTTTATTTPTTTQTTTTPTATTITTALSDAVRYGQSASDDVFYGDDNYRLVYVNPPIPVGAITDVQYFYISTNGNIGLNRPFIWWWWHYYFRWYLTDPVLAVYWSDLDTKDRGSVYYHVYDSDYNTMDSTVYDTAKRLILKNYPRSSNFEPTWILVVTWENMDFYGWWWWYWSPSYSTETFSFQCIVASDRINTYVVYNYMDIDLQRWYWYYVALGYRNGPFQNDLIMNPFMKQNWRERRKTIFRIGELPGNVKGSYGIWSYRLTTGLSKVPPDELACYRWYMRNRFSYFTYYYLTFEPDFVCPCWENMILRRYDFRWRFHREIWMWGYYRLTCYHSMSFRYPYSAECCYRWGRYVRWVFWYGYGTFLTYNPSLAHQLYYQDNELPIEQCFKTRHYEWIRQVRPRTYCYTRSPFRIAWTFGDPHIKTLDNKQYTFNGYGEYTMLEVQNENKTFTLQARTELAINSAGNTTNATVFTGFAAKDNSNATLQVELSPNRTTLIIFGNGADRTTQFAASQNFSRTESNLILGRENETLEAYFPAAAVTLKITVGVRLLTVVTIAPDDIKGQTRGLLGNFDDNPDNDFLRPDGTTISTNSTQRELYYNFGQQWRITPEQSLFNYTSGMSAADYSHPDFEPLFVDEQDPAKVANATAECGGASASQACIFDLLATGDEELAMQSGQSDAQGDADSSTISNEVPSITGNSTIYVTVNETVQLRYNATDDGTVNVTFLDQPATNFAYNVTSEGNVFVTWTPVDASEANISVTAMDNTGASASPLDTVIVLCSGCSGNGVCNNSDTVSTDNPNFFNAKCECNTGWSGDDCSSDFDGCSEQPCDPDRTCIDLSPAEHVQLDRSYNCSGCPAGYKENDTKCVDIDECDETPNICEQECVNSEGNYSCECYSTYRMLDSVCVDIDECAEQTADCQQICTNVAGNYTCSCVNGYNLMSDGKTCDQYADVCSSQSLTCSYACANTTGTWECICPRGFKLGSDHTSCVDINECNTGVCTQNCTNNNGSYVCSCYSGYTLKEDKTTCEACSVPYYGQDCAHICSCGVGVDTCDPVQGCVCLEGYEGDDCGDDIDECTVNPGTCSSDMICENLDGSYECKCYSGFTKINNTCVDDDECNDPLLQTCPSSESTCQNNAGSFSCLCNSGYNQNGTHSCSDIDECAIGIHNCEQMCENVAGSYNCKCEFGFSLNADRETCNKVSDPCAAYGNLTCSYGCRLNGTSVSCFCESGYQLATDGATCLDVNECSDNTLNMCTDKNTCVNTEGGFTCTCDTGYKLENDGVTCTECDAYHYGTDCANLCDCGAGAERCDKVTGCVCRTGWAGTKCDADKDECQLLPSVCTGVNTQCLNSPGSYVCRCLTGYTSVVGTNDCEDIDECSTSTTCSQICTNSHGSYACSCLSGFRLVSGTTCTDIDECSAATPYCDQDCINTIGGYKCSCKDGFLLNSTTRNTCYAKTECADNHPCNQTCALNSALQEICLCTSGYRLNADNVSCDNINECTESSPCSSGTCNDKIPGFECTCDVGMKIDVDGVTCIDCTDWTYGSNCGSNCSCVSENSLSCNATNGYCTCKSGWSGSECATDIDECSNVALFSCPQNSLCVNTNGSYICSCSAGFVYTGSECIACGSESWGEGCSNQCGCELQNSVDCNDVNGTCTCQQGWEGVNCTDDINECNNSPCGSNSECENTVGSYRCTCVAGWTGSGGNCNVDIDECLQPPPVCGSHGNCTNFQGTYNCSCDKGWSGTHCDDGNCFIDRTICQGNTECVAETGGNTTCQCLPGYDATCTVKDTAVQRLSVELTLDLEIDINLNIDDNTTDDYSEVFQNIRTALINYYQTKLGSYFIGIIVFSIRRGSLIASHEVVTVSSDASAAAVSSAVQDLIALRDYIIYNSSAVNVTSVTTSNGVTITASMTDCEIFELIRTCASGYKCVTVGGNTYCQVDGTGEKSSNTAMIIGFSVGGSLLVVIIIIIIVVIVCKKKKGTYNTKRNISLAHVLRKRQASVHSLDFGNPIMKREHSGASYKSNEARGSSAGSHTRNIQVLTSEEKNKIVLDF